MVIVEFELCVLFVCELVVLFCGDFVVVEICDL